MLNESVVVCVVFPGNPGHGWMCAAVVGRKINRKAVRLCLALALWFSNWSRVLSTATRKRGSSFWVHG